MMTDQIFARALLLAGELDGRQQDLLRILCEACGASLAARLRDGLTPEDCPKAFITAASLYALADMGGFEEVTEFKAGDLTVKQKSAQEQGRTAEGLRQQADRLMGPYLKDRFAFTGV